MACLNPVPGSGSAGATCPGLGVHCWRSPKLDATKVVLAAANDIKGQLPPREAMPAEERAVWNILEELDICYRRDHTEIETAHRVMSQAGMLPNVS